ncbi:hypothetical protein IQ266_07130 [filamentous cyanobacterium LEGE 11480]|uniref:Uncharacterized protein n=1 Tax=Romeriopsis navalis LEGE 11480 TaxID=2777977 RepID=A0A928VJL5_9CYAN|nr:hypothetical protein [Romeriopsis navalis]MBE9029535.1 hypothetical protein [Romeriopsis navalis LEGE 11480]
MARKLSSKKSLDLSKDSPSNTEVWPMVAVYLVVCVAFFVPGMATIAKFLYPFLTFLIALFLYKNDRPLYLGFCWCSWILTSGFTRIVEYNSGSFDANRLMLSAPYLVGFAVLPSVVSRALKVKSNLVPMLIPIMGVLYASIVALIADVSLMSFFKDFLDWLAPLLFAFFIVDNWSLYPRFREVTIEVFKWSVVVLGIYGVVQFVLAPPWDRYWLNQISANGLAGNSFGLPQPFGIRVFSLMDSPGVFAIFLSAALLIQLSTCNMMALVASMGGYLSFLLTVVRSVWGGWSVGLLFLISMPQPRLHRRVLFAMLCIACLLLPIVWSNNFSDIIVSRFETFGDLESDGSGQARLSIYAKYLNQALESFVGMGIGRAPGVDSALLDSLLSLGWIGVLPYLAGLLIPIYLILKRPIENEDTFLQACKAIYIATLLQLPFGSAMLGPSGVILWGFAGFVIAGCKFHRRQQYQNYVRPPIS